ncbi:hypothetical protein Sste5346_008310 [Sporothrix stenoceras]|uniref:Uncharacterized protein n=1 Tax=Sporothrix stenoceras TaxID=5173 RepID=A0ABR3YR27_9PEZI
MMRVREPCNIDDSQLLEGNVGEPIRGLPLDVPTDMSYYMQRMRLSKVARGIVDRMPMVSGTQFVGGPASSSASAASLLAAYRESAIASDAELDAMLKDMPLFLRFETYEQTQIEWTEDDEDGKSPKTTIVLLIDLCADNGTGSEMDTGDDSPDTSAAFAALQIVSDARPYSPAAAELYTSLTQLLANHRPQLLEEGLQRLGTSMPEISSATTDTAQSVIPATSATITSPLNNATQDYSLSNLAFNDAMYTNPMALHFDGLDDLAQFQWDDLLAGVDTTMFV